MTKDEEDRHHNELSNMALAAGKSGAIQAVAEFWATLGVNIADEKQKSEVRDLFIFLFAIFRATKTARHQAWLTFIMMTAGAAILAAGQAVWMFIKSKFQ